MKKWLTSLWHNLEVRLVYLGITLYGGMRSVMNECQRLKTIFNRPVFKLIVLIIPLTAILMTFYLVIGFMKAIYQCFEYIMNKVFGRD